MVFIFDPTDWYTYDIQFDPGGYSLVVAHASTTTELVNRHEDISNLADTDWVALANLFPIQPPEFDQSFSMSFTPVPLKGTSISPTPTKNPVIIIPGIMGSYLHKEDGTEVWMNLLKMTLPGNDSYLDDLKLSNNGISLITLNSPGIIESVNVPLFTRNVFSQLENDLEVTGYVKNQDLFEFAYDWRLNIISIANTLDQKINQIKTTTGANKVDVIAHSMGGLIVKEYLNNFSNSVDRLIDLATPHYGAARSFTTSMYGETDIGILSQSKIKEISQNMPSVYQLLPSEEYVDSYGSYFYDLDDLDSNNVRGGLNYPEIKEYMKNSGRNASLIDAADTFHQDLDDLDPRDYGVKTYNIVSCGVPTLGKIFALNKELSGGVEYNISYTDGDGTVPLKSAEAMSADETYYVEGGVHATMPSTIGVKELVAAILADDTNFDLSQHSNLSTSPSVCGIPNGQIVSFHSPIDLHVTDAQGNHVGPNASGDMEYGIPDVAYDIIEGNKFAFIPEGSNYTVTGKATGVGTFNARIQKVDDGDVVGTEYYYAVPLTTTAGVKVDNGSISIDANSDGVYESVVQPSSILGEGESADITKPVTQIVAKGNKNSAGSYTSSVNIRFEATDDNSGVLRTEYRIGEGPWKTYEHPFVLNKRGVYNLQYRSVDKTGNIEAPKTLKIEVTYLPTASDKK